MSALHTPGPWFAGRLVLADADDDFGTISVGQQDLSDRPNKDAHYEDTICEVWQNPNLAEDAESNARLIAAAPEMLEALEAASWLLADISPIGLVKTKVDAAIALASIPAASSAPAQAPHAAAHDASGGRGGEDA